MSNAIDLQLIADLEAPTLWPMIPVQYRPGSAELAMILPEE